MIRVREDGSGWICARGDVGTMGVGGREKGPGGATKLRERGAQMTRCNFVRPGGPLVAPAFSFTLLFPFSFLLLVATPSCKCLRVSEGGEEEEEGGEKKKLLERRIPNLGVRGKKGKRNPYPFFTPPCLPFHHPIARKSSHYPLFLPPSPPLPTNECLTTKIPYTLRRLSLLI